MPKFEFIEHFVSAPLFIVEADTLEEAVKEYDRRKNEGVDPNREPVVEDYLVDVWCKDHYEDIKKVEEQLRQLIMEK